MADIKFNGLDELLNGLNALKKGCDIGTAKVVKHCGAMCQREEMRKVKVVTGTLKRSIYLEISNGGLTATIEPTANYASYVEFGTRFMAARPYVRPAYRKATNEFKKRMKRLVK